MVTIRVSPWAAWPGHAGGSGLSSPTWPGTHAIACRAGFSRTDAEARPGRRATISAGDACVAGALLYHHQFLVEESLNQSFRSPYGVLV